MDAARGFLIDQKDSNRRAGVAACDSGALAVSCLAVRARRVRMPAVLQMAI